MDDSATEPARPAANKAWDGVSEMLETISQAAIRSIHELKDCIKPPVLRLAADLLRGADSVCLIGPDEAYPVAALLARGLGERGRHCEVRVLPGGNPDAGSRQQEFPRRGKSAGVASQREIHRFGKGDLLIVLRMPDNRLPDKALAIARRRGARVLAITDSSENNRAADADALLPTPPARVYGMLNLTGYMTVAQLLLIALDQRTQ